MKVLRQFLGAACLCALVSVSPAQAATYSVMTFDNITPRDGPDAHIWVEDGITAHARESDGSPTWIGSWDVPGTAHMTDASYSWPDSITFTMSHLFSAVSFDILPNFNWFLPSSDTDGCLDPNGCGIPFNNVEVTGMRDGAIIAYANFYMGDNPWTYFFASEFSKLDTLIIALLLPGPDAPAGVCIDAPCTYMSIDNVTLSPVPLPAPLLLFLTGLGALALLGRVGKGGAKQRTAS